MTSILLKPFAYLILQLPLQFDVKVWKRVVIQTLSYEPNPILITSIYSWPFLNFDLFFSAYFVAIYPFGKQVKDIKWPLWWISVIHIVEGKVLLLPILTYSLMLLLFSPPLPFTKFHFQSFLWCGIWKSGYRIWNAFQFELAATLKGWSNLCWEISIWK